MNEFDYIYNHYVKHFELEKNDKTFEEFTTLYKSYLKMPDFKANGNAFNEKIFDDPLFSKNDIKKIHYIMRIRTGYYLTKAFESMKVDLTDDNVKEDMETGNIGTPQRIAKVWCGGSINDTNELGGGRWSEKPRLAKFPNTSKDRIPITKKVTIISNCSHHFITFSSIARPDSYALISYIPDKFVLGISKLQRLTNYIAQRFWLQEDLTKALYDEMTQAAETDSVYVKLVNLTHGCEVFRGAKTFDGSFSTEYFGGDFNDIDLRKSVLV